MSPWRVQDRALVGARGAEPAENFEFLLFQRPLICLLFVLLKCAKWWAGTLQWLRTYCLSKLGNSLDRYWCYMLTLQALAFIEGSWVQTGRSIWKYVTGTLAPSKGPRALCKPVPLFSTTGKYALLQAEWLPNQWRTSTTNRNNYLLTDELLRVTRKCWSKLRNIINNSFGH